MVDKEAIIAAIGADRYKETCLDAWKKAAKTGRERNSKAMFHSEVPDEIEELIWGKWRYGPEAMQNDVEKVKLTFQIYTDMPCYAFVSQLSMYYIDLSPEAKALFWSHVRALLSQEDEALSASVDYSLWCDFFEHHNMVEEAWIPLTQDISNAKLIERLLCASGPVPFKLKEALYEKLIDYDQWQIPIYTSLLRSRFDFFGQINVPKARSILQQLYLPEDTEGLLQLREFLDEDEDLPEKMQPDFKHHHGMRARFQIPRDESEIH